MKHYYRKMQLFKTKLFFKNILICVTVLTKGTDIKMLWNASKALALPYDNVGI